MAGMVFKTVILLIVIKEAAGQCAWPPCPTPSTTTTAGPTTTPVVTTDGDAKTTEALPTTTVSTEEPTSAESDSTTPSPTQSVPTSTTGEKTTPVVASTTTPRPEGGVATYTWIIGASCAGAFVLLMIPVIYFRKSIGERLSGFKIRRCGFARLRLCTTMEDGGEDVIYEMNAVSTAASVAVGVTNVALEVMKEKDC